jgi:hypothetical protein
MWYKDTPGQQDKRTTDNKGFTARKKLTALSKWVQMMGKLHLQSHFLDLDFIIGRVCHESKRVPTSSQFNLQIHVIE